jgi:NAD(P)-dependent dehydrogenase (short-subunit alcohol dehydrogenase family)
MEFCIVISGAGKGIGLALTKELIHKFKTGSLFYFPNYFEGEEKRITAVKIIALSRQLSEIQNLKKKLEQDERSQNITILPIQTALDNKEGLQKTLAEIDTVDGPIHSLINNAAEFAHTPFGKISVDEVERIYFTNVIAPIMLTQGIFHKLKMEIAHVVNIGSVGGIQGSLKFPGFSIYSSSKMALAGITECLATEMPENVFINCLALGSVNTGMLKKAFPDYTSKVSPTTIASYILGFLLSAPGLQNGKVVEVSLMNP